MRPELEAAIAAGTSPVCVPWDDFSLDVYHRIVDEYPCYDFTYKSAHRVNTIWFTPNDYELRQTLARMARAEDMVTCHLFEMMYRKEPRRVIGYGDTCVSNAVERFNGLGFDYEASILSTKPVVLEVKRREN